MNIDLTKQHPLFDSARFVARALADKNEIRWQYLMLQPEKNRLAATDGHRMHWCPNVVERLNGAPTTDIGFAVKANRTTAFTAIEVTDSFTYPDIDKVMPDGYDSGEYHELPQPKNARDLARISDAYSRLVESLIERDGKLKETLHLSYFIDAILTCPYYRLQGLREPIIFADDANGAAAHHFAIIMPQRT